MALLKKRGTAVAVFVIVVVVFTLIGCHRSLGRACARVEDAFFTHGALSEYGAYSAPAEQLGNCVKLANRLLSVIHTDAYADSYDAILTARQDLADALEKRSIPDIYSANTVLVREVSALDAKIDRSALPPSSDDYAVIVSDLFSAQRVVNESPYNAYVDSFIESTVRPFPTDILRRLSFTALPDKYE